MVCAERTRSEECYRAGALPSKTAFVLQNGVNLDQHVSHKIEVTGKVAPASANVAPDSPDIVVPPPQAEPAGRAAGAGRAGGTTRTYLPALTVQSVKMIATSREKSSRTSFPKSFFAEV